MVEADAFTKKAENSGILIESIKDSINQNPKNGKGKKKSPAKTLLTKKVIFLKEGQDKASYYNCYSSSKSNDPINTKYKRLVLCAEVRKKKIESFGEDSYGCYKTFWVLQKADEDLEDYKGIVKIKLSKRKYGVRKIGHHNHNKEFKAQSVISISGLGSTSQMKDLNSDKMRMDALYAYTQNVFIRKFEAPLINNSKLYTEVKNDTTVTNCANLLPVKDYCRVNKEFMVGNTTLKVHARLCQYMENVYNAVDFSSTAVIRKPAIVNNKVVGGHVIWLPYQVTKVYDDLDDWFKSSSGKDGNTKPLEGKKKKKKNKNSNKKSGKKANGNKDPSCIVEEKQETVKVSTSKRKKRRNSKNPTDPVSGKSNKDYLNLKASISKMSVEEKRELWVNLSKPK